ncbi:MAG: TonB family protein [Paracoccaceae bacterium]|nr:TonB family protein [Paracoccaceae bacterium]
MTRLRQFTVATLALTLSGGLHAAGFIGLTPQTDVALQGGAADSLPTLGDSFADMAQGAAFAAPPPDTARPEPTARTIPAVRQTAPVPPVQASPVPVAETIPSVKDPQMAALTPVATPHAATPVTPNGTIAAAPESDTAAPDQSLRPQSRPDRPATQVAAHRATAETAPRRQTRATPQPQGNADRNATRGTATGQETAKAATAPSRQATAQGDGGAAASASYGRAVLTQISRTRKARAPARGRTVVAFSISDAGALASVKVLQSSGSTDLDQVALDHIRRAAPFPKPPSGARRQFSFEFVGRS